jgi:hypothetical protein
MEDYGGRRCRRRSPGLKKRPKFRWIESNIEQDREQTYYVGVSLQVFGVGADSKKIVHITFVR